MNKLSKTFEKLKIKSTPGSFNDIKDTCKKLQAIIDRRLYNEARNKVPSYNEELSFYSIFIPNLVSNMSYYKDFDNNIKMLVLQKIINIWIRENFTKCGKLATVFNKEFPLTTELPKRVLSTSKKMYMSPMTMTPLKKKNSVKKNSLGNSSSKK